MPGASENTRRVKTMNANWTAGEAGKDGRFELMLITSNDEHHILEPSSSAMTALVALAQATPCSSGTLTTALSSRPT
jgi:hypothetical protein